MRRAALAVLVVAASLFAMAPHPAYAAAQQPSQASVLPQPRADPAPPPADAAWQPVQLPDDASISRPRQGKLPAWYRIAFDYPSDSTPPVQWATYLPYFYDGGSLWLNGALLASVAENSASMHARSYRPQMVMLPPTLLRPGRNELDVRTAPSGIYPLRFPLVSVGPLADIEPLYDRRLFWSRSVPEITVVVSLLVSGFVLVIWWRRRAEVLYGLFGLAALLWGIRTMTFLVDELPIHAWQWWRIGYHSATGGFIVVMALFTLRYAELHKPWLERALVAYWLIGPLWYAVQGFGAEPMVARAWLGGMIPIGLGIIVIAFWTLRRRRTLASFALPVAMTITALVGIYDYLLSWYTPLLHQWIPQWVGHRIHLLHYGSNTLLLAMGALLAARFIHTLSSLEDLNRTLESRVADRERALADNYARVAALEREHAASEERQLIMRDLHDGLGSQLFTSLSRVERGDMSNQQIATSLRTCIADMRLALDALASEQHDLAAALGNFMFRWESQLVAAGVRPRWQVDLPPQDATPLSPHAALQMLRVAQEALTNVLKHAGATEVQVRISRHGGDGGSSDGSDGTDAGHGFVEMEVQDNGHGMTAGASPSGRGLTNMRTRAHRLGGQLDLHSAADGTCVVLRLPVSHAAAAA